MDKGKNFAAVQYDNPYQRRMHRFEFEIRRNLEGEGAGIFIRSITGGCEITNFPVAKVDVDTIMLEARGLRLEHLMLRSKVDECIVQLNAIV